jgi:hypothetical protein
MKKLLSLSTCFDTILPSHGPAAGDGPDRKADRRRVEVAAGNVPPQEPPFEMPAKMYVLGRRGVLLVRYLPTFNQHQ